MTLLLTGFVPFGTVAVNPSQQIVEALAGRWPDVVTAVLPVEYEGANVRIRQLIAQHQPRAVISLGVASGRDAITPERIAVNRNHDSLPDNAGRVASGECIAQDGPAEYHSTLPLESMIATLSARGIPAEISDDAGTYLCNHVFYVARHVLEGTGIPSGFIHIPAASENESPGLPLALMLDGIAACIEVVRAVM